MATEQEVVAFAFSAILVTFSCYAGILLLRLRPANRARSFIAAGLCLAPLPAVYGLRVFVAPSAVPFLAACLVIGVGGAYILSALFLTTYPSPVPWRSPVGALAAITIFLAIVTTLLDLTNNLAMPISAPSWFDFGAYSWQRGLLLALLTVAAASRARALPAHERRIAIRVLVAFAAAAVVFAGYSIIQAANALAHGPLDDHLARYKLLTTQGIAADPYDLFVNLVVQPLTTVGLLAVFAIGHRDRLAWLLAGIGALAYVLDQFTRANIIDHGVVALVTPAILLREATHRGALGVQKVPARLGLPVAAAAGLAVVIAILGVASLVAADQPLVMSLSLVLGVATGGALTYALRPRGVALTMTMTFEGQTRAIATAMTATEDHIAGRYRLEQPLGAGAEGQTFLANDDRIGRKVVLKSVRSGGIREAQIVGKVDHPNVVRVLDVLEEKGKTFLVLEYVEGGDLRSHLNRRGALPEAEADRLLSGMLSGLEAVHALGIVHGDLKPENILLAASGEPKLADFGIARHGGGGTIVAGAGTLGYLSPEGMRGAPSTVASDIYAMGVIYGEILTGSRAIPPGLDDIAARALVVAAAPAPKVAGARGAVLARALALDPRERFATAREMREALASPAQ